MNALPFGLGVSLYSYTEDIGVTMTVEDCIEDVADLGATGLEILGEGHIADYPNPSTAWIDAWFARNERLGLTPTLYGSWIDTRRFPGARTPSAQQNWQSTPQKRPANSGKFTRR